MNSNHRRRNFRRRPQKNNFRRRGGQSVNSVSSNSFGNNGNLNFSRNGSMNNIHNVEKAMQKYQLMAKDAQSSGDPVLVENYLQHADHYLRRYNELNDKRETLNDKTISQEKSLNKEEDLKKENQVTTN